MRLLPFTIEPRAAPSQLWLVASPVLAVVLTLVAGMLLFALLGHDPWAALRVFLIAPLDGPRALGELALKSTPLMLIGVGLALAFRANVWNIGAEGQLIAGALAAGGTALALGPALGVAGQVPVLLAALLGGAAWAALTAMLRDRCNANEILVSLMLVYVAQLLLSWVVQGPWRDPQGFGFPQTALFDSALRLPLLVAGTRLNLGFALALLVAAAAAVLLARTLAGLQLRVLGAAPAAARYAGYSQRRVLWGALLGSGALAGLAGGLEVMGPLGQLTPSISPGYGFAAIIVAFVGRLQPLGVVLAAIVMAQFYIGGELAQSRLGLPSALTGIYQGLLLFLLLACDTLVLYRVRRLRAPRAAAAGA